MKKHSALALKHGNSVVHSHLCHHVFTGPKFTRHLCFGLEGSEVLCCACNGTSPALSNLVFESCHLEERHNDVGGSSSCSQSCFWVAHQWIKRGGTTTWGGLFLLSSGWFFLFVSHPCWAWDSSGSCIRTLIGVVKGVWLSAAADNTMVQWSGYSWES